MRGTFGKRLAGLDLTQVAAAGRSGRRTAVDAGRHRRWPREALARPGSLALAYAVRALVALVQPPPRGLWRSSGAVRHSTVEAWLGRPPAAASSPDAMMRRYLAAFGPASVADAQVWSGLSRLNEVSSGCVRRYGRSATNVDASCSTCREPRGRIPTRQRRRASSPNTTTCCSPTGSHAHRRRHASTATHRGQQSGSGRADRRVCRRDVEHRDERRPAQRSRSDLLRGSRRATVPLSEEEGERLAAFLVPESTHRSVVFASRRT